MAENGGRDRVTDEIGGLSKLNARRCGASPHSLMRWDAPLVERGAGKRYMLTENGR